MKHVHHAAFCLNRIPYSYEDIAEIAYSLIKEGEPFEKEIGDFLLDWISDSPHIVQQTSGSTGPPKPILLEKEKMVASARATGAYFGLGAGTRALLCLPASTIAGKMMWVRAMVLGWSLYYVKPSLNPLKELGKPIDFTALTPAQVRSSLKSLPKVGRLIIGGAPVSRALLRTLKNFSAEIYETYGMTETITHVAVKPISGPRAISPDGPFQALPDIRFEQDARGCLVVYAPYLGEEPVVTNDQVELLSETTFRWLGRADRVVNSGGIKLFPETLETKLSEFMDHRFFLAGEKDPQLGERLVMVVEGTGDGEALLASLKEKVALEKNHWPRAVYWTEAFAETRSGKIDRPSTLKQLRAKRT
ncbi:AMP-binding protein [Robiginitalea sp. M366]|uniref:AMP-binding protein n=1 Tax=Robiginitalea aestuariiviva TaxID=3036903 RepID=UPI00240D6EA3|nr:AMP-binding protein [Robiginitalea aestuariiviva]MDG1573068.1 AMP-binding protein [Robiginitalea aestuariiviva]